jgi:protein-disulfide isomerase
MKRAFPLVLALSVAALFVQSTSAQQATSGKTPAPKSAAKSKPAVPPPVAVEVIAVDPAAKTITVRDVAAVPAPPGTPVEITIPVAPAATGEKLKDVTVGEKVDVTCTIKPTVHPTAGVPIVLTDCARVIKIQPTGK